MARYTCLFTVAAPIDTLRASLVELLNSLGFDIIYQTEDYVMGRERPGKVSFSQLVVVEVLIDRTTVTGEEVQMSFVIKNEELPLQIDNHCRQVFNIFGQAMADNQHWRLIETIAS
jgi:hypothetical protein